MDPISLGIAAVGTIVSSAFGAYTAYQGAKVQQQGAQIQQKAATELGQYQAGMYEYQAGTAEQFAKASDTQARLILEEGGVQAQQAGLVSRGTVGEEISTAAAGNIGVGSGSTSRVVGSQIAIGQENEAIARANAANTAYGEKLQAASYTAEAGGEQAAAAQALTAGGISAAGFGVAGTAAGIAGIGSVVSGVGSVASKWYQVGSTSPGGGSPATPTSTAPPVTGTPTGLGGFMLGGS